MEIILPQILRALLTIFWLVRLQLKILNLCNMTHFPYLWKFTGSSLSYVFQTFRKTYFSVYTYLLVIAPGFKPTSLLCFVTLVGWNPLSHISPLLADSIRLGESHKGHKTDSRRLKEGTGEILLQVSINHQHQSSLWQQQRFQQQQLAPVSNFLLLCFSRHSQSSLIESLKIPLLSEQAEVGVSAPWGHSSCF